MKKNIITEINDLLNKNNKKLTVESLVFNETDEPGYDYIPDFENAEEESEPKEVQNIPENNAATDVINKIRVMALQGIAKLADQPQSPQYDCLKKVWQLLDKTVEMKKEG